MDASSSVPDHANLHPLSGQLVVFSGRLGSLGRREARALVSRLGGQIGDDVNLKTTLLVMGSEGGGAADRDKSHKVKRAEELNAQGSARIQIVAEAQFCELAGVPSVDSLRRQYYAVRDLLGRYRSLREVQVRYLMKCGIVQAVHRTHADTFVAFPALAVLKQANDELGEGAAFEHVVRSLLAAKDGQLVFDFRLDAEPAKILTLSPRDRRPPAALGTAAPAAQRETALAEEYFRAASQLDGDEANLDQAAAAYRKALELDPYLVAALINLANIHYSRDELAEAQALYERAIGLESDFFEAHFNLGNIYHDLARFAEAQACYREAIRLNPSYADAHFYLAVTCEKLGQSREARPHWRAYQDLAPNGEWVELAREFSE